jgi:hypothetical protein
MPQFFLHLREDGGLLRDHEGREYLSLSEAREEAVRSAHELMSDSVTIAANPTDSRFEIADETGAIVLVVPFDEALREAD